MTDTAKWISIGNVVGNTSTDRFTFILKSMKAKLGDIVATRLNTPTGPNDTPHDVLVWGRIVSIDRFNPFFPAEAAQELAEESHNFLDTVLSNSRDHLQADVLILGTTKHQNLSDTSLVPLTYPVQPSAEVLFPPANAVTSLLVGPDDEKKKLKIGTLIGRGDVPVEISANDVVSRHLAILAMTGGGKTVAARRIIRELIQHRYPLIIFDPHGDYLGFYEKKKLFESIDVRLFFPRIFVSSENMQTVNDLIERLGSRMTDPQMQFFNYLISNAVPREESTAAEFIEDLIDHAKRAQAKKRKKEDLDEDIQNTLVTTIGAVVRNLTNVKASLDQMEKNNDRLRRRLAQFHFEAMPDPRMDPEQIIKPGQLSIFYLAGYDHLSQSAIVSIILENLFNHRANLTGQIPPFQAVVEEAHNFIPSRSEGTSQTPSISTIRKVITEGRKFGTGLILISQRPARLDETTLAQCNSFLVLRVVNPKDKNFVRSVMENLSESDANILQAFGRGQGLVSGQAVRFPLLVQIEFDADLESDVIGDENFIEAAAEWKPSHEQKAKASYSENISKSNLGDDSGKSPRRKKTTKKGGSGVRPEGF